MKMQTNIPDYIQVFPDATIYNSKTHRYLNGSMNSSGYIQITIKGKKYLRSHIVAEKYCKNDFNNCGNLEIDHIDGDTTNDIASNLRWCTHQENCKNRKPGGSLRKLKKLYNNLNENKKREFIREIQSTIS